MMMKTSLLTGIDNGTHHEENTTSQERDVDALLQDLDMTISSLIDLARVVD